MEALESRIVDAMRVIHTPGLIIILIEAETTFRQIFTDGRTLPGDPQRSWWARRWAMGRRYAGGRHGGLNSRTWLDAAERPAVPD
jgi:hypothetical protein